MAKKLSYAWMVLGLLFVVSLSLRSAGQEVVGTLKISESESKPLKTFLPKGVVHMKSADASKPGKLQFAGEGKVEITDDALSFGSSFTIEFDLQIKSLNGNPYLVSKRSKVGSDIQSGYWIELIPPQGDPEFKTGQAFLDFFAAGGTARATLQVDPKKSYHIVAVHKDLGEGKGMNLLFVDGQQQGAGDVKEAAPANDAPLTLGDYVNGYHEFHGSISGLCVSASATLPVSAQGTLPAGATADIKANAVPDHVIGERDSLSKLVGVVRKTLESHQMKDQTVADQLLAIQSAVGKATTLEGLGDQRSKLGKLVGGAAAKAYGKDFIAWKQNRWADLSAHDWPDAKPDDSISLSYSMAGDAYGSQAVAVSNTTSGALALKVDVASDSKGGPKIAIRRGWQVPCPDLAFRPDPLALANEGKLTLLPGETTLVWFELDSHGASAGSHVLPIKISSGKTSLPVELTVTVSSVKMPQVLDCTLFNYSYLDEMGFIRKYKAEAFEDLRRHYINTYVIAKLPDVKADAEGNLTGSIDYTGVDAQIAMYRPHGRKLIFFWGANITADLEIFPNLKFLSEPWKKALVAFYRQWVQHLEEIGLTPDDYIMYPFDETSRPEAKAVYDLLKPVAPQVKLLLNPTTGYKRAEVEAIAPTVDIWQPSYEAVVKPHPDDYAFMRSTGKNCWVYSCANGTPMPTYDYNLLRHWVAWKLGMTGVSQWCYSDHGGWESDDSWKFVRGAFAMVYAREHAPKDLPLPEALTPSRRWEAWREGAQDYQLLNMARAKAATSPEIDAVLKKVVAEAVDHPEDLDAADRGRAELLQVLSKQ